MEHNMSFVNEKVSEQDIEKYGLREINKKFFKGDHSYFWTIDRANDVYLRSMGNNWQEPEEQVFSFYWKGHQFQIDLRICDSSGVRGGAGSVTWGLSSNTTEKMVPLPQSLEAYRSQITADLKDALRAYKDGGYFSATTEYTAHFLF
jgi:hypothetical protein